MSVSHSHIQIGVPELRTYCFDPWALLDDPHLLRLWILGPRVLKHARSFRSVTQWQRAGRVGGRHEEVEDSCGHDTILARRVRMEMPMKGLAGFMLSSFAVQ